MTDRKEGTPPDFEAKKPFILQAYAADLQRRILTAQRKTAKPKVLKTTTPPPPPPPARVRRRIP